MTSNMDRPATKSVATDNEGTANPDHINPIADAKHGGNVRVVGFMYRGNGYGQSSAWITCDESDLLEMPDAE